MVIRVFPAFVMLSGWLSAANRQPRVNHLSLHFPVPPRRLSVSANEALRFPKLRSRTGTAPGSPTGSVSSGHFQQSRSTSST